MPNISAQEALKTLSPDVQHAVEEGREQFISEYQSLKALRQELGLTQNEVAELLSLNQSNVSELEGRKDMLISSLKNYAQALGYEMKISFQKSDSPEIRIDNAFN
jgi:DNA-binding transcriptional regulator YiaG